MGGNFQYFGEVFRKLFATFLYVSICIVHGHFLIHEFHNDGPYICYQLYSGLY